jgi:two-component system chemotaxis response regulator CheB
LRAIRVLVVDDSAVVRRIVSDILASDPEVEVAGTAPNGRIALARVDLLDPDIVILDIDMPEMGGLEALGRLRRERPSLPVIMFSTLTERGAAATLDALSLGAKDYVTKPSSTEGSTAAMLRIRGELLPKIKTLCSWKKAAHALRIEPARNAWRPLAALAIGASTGGPDALAALLGGIPPDFPAPVLIVQHMPPIFTRLLAARLASRAKVPVKEASDGDLLQAGRAWLAPGDRHMEVESEGAKVRARIRRDPPEHSCRPSVDVLFRSVARVYGAGALAVVLTGMGQDGRDGASAVRAAAGHVLVQDEASSVVWGMPGNVYRAGLADGVLPIPELLSEILRRAACPAAFTREALRGSARHG